MINLKDCKTAKEVDIFFDGYTQGMAEMIGFRDRVNVNTGKPLKFEELLKDIAIFKEQALSLVLDK